MPNHPVPAPARELTPEEAQERREESFALDQEVKAALADGRAAMWRLAKAIYEFDELACWSALGYESLAHWLADPEVGLRKTQFYALRSRWEQLHVLRKVGEEELKELPPSKVDVVLPAIRAGTVKLEQALGDAKAMGFRDLRSVYRGREEFSGRPENQPATNGDQPDESRTEAEEPDSEPAGPETAPVAPDLESPFLASEPPAVEPEPAPEMTLAEAIEAARDEQVLVHGLRHTLKLALRDVIAAYDRERGAM
jgi:hypothetical protein